MKITITLDDKNATRLVELAGSSRKQGQYLDGLIEAAYQNNVQDAVDMEKMNLQIVGLAAGQKSTDSRMLSVERALAAMIADSQ